MVDSRTLMAWMLGSKVASEIVAVCTVIIRAACLALPQPVSSAAAARVHITVRRTAFHSDRSDVTGFFLDRSASESMRAHFCWAVIGAAEMENARDQIWMDQQL